MLRRTQVFVLTLLSDTNHPGEIRGRIFCIGANDGDNTHAEQEITFIGAEELIRFLAKAMSPKDGDANKT